MKGLARLILGGLAAGLAAGVFGASVLVLVMSRQLSGGSGGGLENWISGLFVFGVIMTLYGLAGAFLVGMPAHLVLSRLKQTGWMPYLAAGLVVGILVALAFGGELALVAAGAAAGLAGASAFWMIVRPDLRRAP